MLYYILVLNPCLKITVSILHSYRSYFTEWALEGKGGGNLDNDFKVRCQFLSKSLQRLCPGYFTNPLFVSDSKFTHIVLISVKDGQWRPLINFSVGCQGHTRFRSKILVLASIKFSYLGPPTSIELKNHMKFMWNSCVVNCHSKPFMTDTKYLILRTRWIGQNTGYW